MESLLYSEDKFPTFSASYLLCTILLGLSRNGSEDFQNFGFPISPYSLFPLSDTHSCTQLYCIVVLSQRKVLPCLHLSPLLQPKLVLSQRLLVQIVLGYYLNFMSAITKSSCFASQPYWCLRHISQVFSGN